MESGIIEKFCTDCDISLAQFYGTVVINGDLNLQYVTKLPNGFNPILTGYLDLRSLKKLPKNFKPIVSNGLHLQNIKYLPKCFKPIVGTLYLNGEK